MGKVGTRYGVFVPEDAGHVEVWKARSMPLTLQALDTVKKYLGEERRRQLRKFQALRFRYLQHLVMRFLFGTRLPILARFYGSDKWGAHWYAKLYETHFAQLRHKKLNILEIGVGGCEEPELGGASLRMWRTYFPRSRVFGIDIHEKSLHDEHRITTFKGSQADKKFLSQVANHIGEIHIIIDDGSHLNEDVFCTFEFMFPRIHEQGIYVIEDTQTSYWSHMGGSSLEPNRPNTTMGFLKSLADGLNYSEFEQRSNEPSYFDRHIVGIHFYHNLVFVQKGKNNEGSNSPALARDWNKPW
jgi:hypothetical protein